MSSSPLGYKLVHAAAMHAFATISWPLNCCPAPLQADNITTLVKAANVEIEPYWPGLFAKLFEKTSIEDLLTNVGSGAFFFAEVRLLEQSAKSNSVQCHTQHLRPQQRAVEYSAQLGGMAAAIG